MTSLVAAVHCGTSDPRFDRSADAGAGICDATCSCPAERPDNGIQCPRGSACIYDDTLCECDPSHGWVCHRACPPQPPAIGNTCSISLDCDYGDSACHCDGATWSCSGGTCATSWPMPNASLLLELYGGAPSGQTMLPNPPSYDVSPSAVVDRLTTLVWQREIDKGARDWTAAAAYCRDLGLLGFTDWRLPTRLELLSITDFTRAAPAIDPGAFPETPIGFYWTSSPRPGSDLAWSVDFESGTMYSGETSFAIFARCVRSDAALRADAGHACYIIDAATVYDVQTHLTWQRRYDPTSYTFPDGQAHCASLDLGGGGWRVPTIKELQTVVDDRRVDPAIDLSVFPSTAGQVFWSSSVALAPESFGWYVDFFSGYTFAYEQSNANHVRCVR